MALLSCEEAFLNDSSNCCPEMRFRINKNSLGIKKRRIHIFCFVFKTDLFLIDDFTPFKSNFLSIFFT